MRLLTWTSIDAFGIVRWNQHKTTLGHSARLRVETMEAIQHLKVCDPFRVFPLSKSSTERLIQEVFAAAKIKKPAKQSLGHIRHTGGTAIAAKSGNDAARRALGHTADSRVLESHYLDASQLVDDYRDWWNG